MKQYSLIINFYNFIPDVVSSNGNAIEGVDEDYPSVSHNVVFGASDSPEDTMVFFDITVQDDDFVEFQENFMLNLRNVNGGLIGVPRVAEVMIEDNDGKFNNVSHYL